MKLEVLQQTLPQVTARGASLIAISPQRRSFNQAVKADHGLSYPLLSDPGNELAAAFGIRLVLPEDQRQLQRSMGLDLETFNGDDSWSLPAPARFIIGCDGVIVGADTSPEIDQRPDTAELLEILDRTDRSACPETVTGVSGLLSGCLSWLTRAWSQVLRKPVKSGLFLDVSAVLDCGQHAGYVGIRQ